MTEQRKTQPANRGTADKKTQRDGERERGREGERERKTGTALGRKRITLRRKTLRTRLTLEKR